MVKQLIIFFANGFDKEIVNNVKLLNRLSHAVTSDAATALLMRFTFAANLFLLSLNGHELIAQILAKANQQNVLIFEMFQHVVSTLVRSISESHLAKTITDRQNLLLVLLNL
jgi:hypothetical protein